MVTNLPFAVYYERLPAQYKDHVKHIGPFKAEVQVTETIGLDLLRTIDTLTWFESVASSNKSKLEARVRELVQSHDANLVLMEEPKAEMTSTRPYSSKEGTKSDGIEAVFTISANGSAFKATGIDIPFE
ncbi:MAG: hypothetical protein Q8R04_05840 [Nanoarchaeota archaeon]|nr:hypothetical protein [Nanoarchaeota archaeon]